MEEVLQKALFEKHLFAGARREDPAEAFGTVFALASLFGIRITAGLSLAGPEMIAIASRELGINVPQPFYRGFPMSVRKLTPQELLYDQLLEYFVSYGMNDFSGEGHSVFEESFERTVFREKSRILPFRIVSEKEAVGVLTESADLLLKSTRPLRRDQEEFILSMVRGYGYIAEHCACKDTAITLLLETEDLTYLRFLRLPDVIAVTEQLALKRYENRNIRKLNLKNRDRKFLSGVIDAFFAGGAPSWLDCYEKKALWSGLLHHIHYVPVNEDAAEFTACMRGSENLSAFSAFEKALGRGEIEEAVLRLTSAKGSGALLRNLDHILSRCRTEEQAESVLSRIDTKNRILLLQLLFRYAQAETFRRTFTFQKDHLFRSHTETDAEMARRRSILPKGIRERMEKTILENLERLLRHQLGKVWYDEKLDGLAVPIQEGASLSGFGALPKGSRMPLPDGKIIRAFTYWEKVNDIDLSVIGLTDGGGQIEFSWRSMAGSQSDAVTFSGDVTRGYNGGSEFFDIDLEAFRMKYPNVHTLVFCDNVFSGSPFSKCFCKAGYMLRDQDLSGEIFEAKTVETSYRIDCASTFAYLFAFDLRADEFVWLNLARAGHERVAGESSFEALTRTLRSAQIFPFRRLIRMMAEEMVEDPAEADLIISDREDLPAGIPVIRSYDFDRSIALLNGVSFWEKKN